MNEFWIQFTNCFTSCCLEEARNDPRKQRRIRIDRSMIGNPSNFVHTHHLGTDLHSETNNFNIHLQSLQKSMSSKGGYESSMPINSFQMKVIDVQN